MLAAKKLINLFFSFVLVMGLLPVMAFASSEGGDSEGGGQPVASATNSDENSMNNEAEESADSGFANDAQGPEEEKAPPQNVAAKEQGGNQTASSASNDEPIEFIYIDQKDISIGETQEVVVSFSDAKNADGSTLYYQKQDGDLGNVKASKSVDGAALYEIPFRSASDCGKYNLVKVTWSGSSVGESAIANDAENGYSFSVVDNVVDGDSDEVSAYSLDSNGGITKEGSVADAIATASEEAASSEAPQDDNGIQAYSSDEGVIPFVANGDSSRASKKMVIALDAGHGGSDSGAVNEGKGLYEKALTLKIAQYCKAELDTYSNVETFMTRSGDEYVGLSERVKRAVNAGANVFVSFHINSAESVATGFEVWVQNDSSWRYYLHEQSSQLGSSILSKLTALGLANRGNKESDSKSGNKYADGSPADYLTVLEQSRQNNIPAVLIEHGFINGKVADQNLLSSESGLKSMGVADARAIAENYGLYKGAPKDAKISAQAHVANIGWMSSVYDGDTAGTTGRSLSLEALQVQLENDYAKQGSVEVRAHVAGIGWQGWTSGTAGTTGQSRAMEAVQVRLTGDLAERYDVWYRVHSAEFGWLGWAKDGESAGSQGYGRAAQAVQVELVEKGGAAPGPTDGAFHEKGSTVPSGQTTPIMGSTDATVDQMVKYFQSTGYSYPSAVYASRGAPTLRDYCQIAYEEARAEGVRAEVLFCQAMKETGWLQFGGAVKADQCNFGGLGATGGSVSGATFSSVREGLRAQVQHLKAYASNDALVNPCVDPRFSLVSRGIAPNCEDLNGRWAVPGDGYGQDIRKMMNSLLSK